MIQSGILTVYVRLTSAYTNSRVSRFAPVWLSNDNYNNSNNGASALNANSNNSYYWGGSNDNAGSGLSVDINNYIKGL